MNQSFSWAAFAGGFSVFAGTLIEVFSHVESWMDFYATPKGAIHLVVIAVAFVFMVGGAFGVQLPRTANYSERKDDPPAVPPVAPAAPAVVNVTVEAKDGPT